MKLLQMKPKRDKINFCTNFWFGPPFTFSSCMHEGANARFLLCKKNKNKIYASTKVNEHGMRMCKKHKGVKNNNIL
jgi:hypothetical protein